MESTGFRLLILFCLWNRGFLQKPFEQGVLFSAKNPLRFSGENRTRFVLQCQPLNNGSGFLRITGIRIWRKTDSSQKFTPVISLAENQTNPRWQDDSIRRRVDKVETRLGNPLFAFIRYEIPPKDTDCTDASYYRCEMDGTSLRFSRVIFITPQVVESQILSLDVSPSNAAPTPLQTRNTTNVYTVGTSVWLTCTARTGNPPVPLRWCLREGDGSFTHYLGDEKQAFSSEGSNARNSCILTQTIFTTYNIEALDTQRLLTFRCEIAFPKRPACLQERLPGGSEEIVLSGSSRDQQGTTTTTTTTTTTGPGLTNVPRTGTSSTDTGENVGLAQAQSISGTAVLILGIVLVLVAVSGIIASAWCLLRARNLRAEAELMLTRSTYDALEKRNVAMETYQTIDSGTRTQTLQVDNDGYIVAR